jgi:hypothetical protein
MLLLAFFRSEQIDNEMKPRDGWRIEQLLFVLSTRYELAKQMV